MIDKYVEIVLIGTALRFTIMDHDNTILNLMWKKIDSLAKRNDRVLPYYKKLTSCPFCNGFWFGLITYSYFSFQNFSAIEGFLAGISTGLFSYFLKESLLYLYLQNESLKKELGYDEELEETEDEPVIVDDDRYPVNSVPQEYNKWNEFGFIPSIPQIEDVD